MEILAKIWLLVATLCFLGACAEKQEQDRDDKQTTFEQVLLNCFDNIVDQLRTVVNGFNLNARRKRGFDFLHLRLEFIGNFVAVFTHEHEAKA